MRGERERGPALSVLAASGRWSQSGHAVAKVRGPAQISELVKDSRVAKSLDVIYARRGESREACRMGAKQRRKRNTEIMWYERGLTVNAKIHRR